MLVLRQTGSTHKSDPREENAIQARPIGLKGFLDKCGLGEFSGAPTGDTPVGRIRYHKPLRRTSAIMLLALISVSLLSPLFASGPQDNLPACCRRGGKHHCSMLSAEGRNTSGPSLRNSPCPQYPLHVFAVQTSSALLVAPAVAPDIRTPKRPSAILSFDVVRSANRTDANSKRGPPLA